MQRRHASLIAFLVLTSAGCRSKVASVRDALLEGDAARAAAIVDAPACTDATCFDPIARQLGAKRGFNANDPDQASAAAVAIVLVRDHRGDLVPDADRWIAGLTLARGYGADALRLAVARGMVAMAPRIGKRLDDAAETAQLVRELAGVLPGACAIYARAGETGAPDESKAQHQCVQRDLERKEGPGAQYPATGVWREAAGVVALWRDEARALRSGLEAADEVVRPVLEKQLAVIERATTAIELTKSH